MISESVKSHSDSSGVKWLIPFRTIIIILSVVVVYLSGGGYSNFPFVPLPIFGLLSSLFVLNIVYSLIGNYFSNKLSLFIMTQMFIDIVVESGLVFFTGGVNSHFVYFFFVSIMTGSILLTRRVSAIFACLCTIGLSSVTVMHLTGTMISHIPDIYFPNNIDSEVYLARMLTVTLAFFLVAFLSGLLQSQLAIAKILNNEILQNMPEGVVVFDNSDKIVFLNEEFRRVFSNGGSSPYIGMHVDKLFSNEPLNSLRQTIIDGRNYRFEMTSLENCNNKPLEVRVSPIGSTANKKGVVVIFIDLSLRNRVEEAERRAERFEAVGEMAAGLAHEVRNPLAAVSGSIQEISGCFSEGSPNRKLCDIIISESNRLDSIITEFLQFARVRPIHITRCDINKLLSEVKLLASKNCNYSDVSIHLEIEKDTNMIIKADADQIKEVCMNIAINACSAMNGKGNLWIKCEASKIPDLYSNKRNREKQGILMIFLDDGPGLKQGVEEKIFEPFFTTKPKGTGLGLSLSKKIINSHNGFMWVESPKNGGAKFFCWLPYDGLPSASAQPTKKRKTTSFLIKG